MLGQPTAPRLVGVGDRRPTTLLILSKTKTRLPLGRAGWRPASTARQPPATLILPPAGPEGNSVETDFRISHLKLSDGHRRLIPREDVEGLQEATPKQIAQVEILGQGTGLHWPALNLDHYVPSLLRQIYGTKRWMAEIGRRGGLVKSTAKHKASRANGLKGGRPRLAASHA